MINKAVALKYAYIGFSEHNPSISKHNKNEFYSILSRRKEKIEQLKSNNKNIRIINLLETDILTNGNIAIDEKSLETLDATIVSIHSSFGMDSEQMTKRVLQGLAHPKAKILAHPTGRKINGRTGYTLQWEKIFAFCKEHNKALEINSWPERTDLPDSLIKEAIQHGVKLIINSDSHATHHMDLLQYGIWNARRGWATKDDILNTLGYNQFIEWLTS
jgi:DNA polymerase (family 10)